MVASNPSGLLTCFVRFSTLRTTSRFWGAWALAVCWWLIACADAIAAPDRTVLVLGDSLSAGYGIKPAQGWVALLEQRLHDQALRVQGRERQRERRDNRGADCSDCRVRLELHRARGRDRRAGRQRRTAWSERVALTTDNLTKIVAAAKQSGAQVLLVGMRLPPNYGPRYTNDFMRMYREIATNAKVGLVPFLLQSVALKPELMQDDGLHPTAPAQPALLDTVWPYLKPLLKTR